MEHLIKNYQRKRMKIKKKIREKLNTRGASIILALIVFIIVAFVSVAIVNASILNAKRTLSEKIEEKAYSATTQAIDLIRSNMKEDAAYIKKDGEDSELTGMTGQLGETVHQLVDNMGESGGAEKRISFSCSGLEDINGTLMGKLTIEPSYTITVDVWVQLEGEKEYYPLTLIIPGTSKTIKDDVLRSDDPSVPRKETKYVSWSKDGMYVTGKYLTGTN